MACLETKLKALRMSTFTTAKIIIFPVPGPGTMGGSPPPSSSFSSSLSLLLLPLPPPPSSSSYFFSSSVLLILQTLVSLLFTPPLPSNPISHQLSHRKDFIYLFFFSKLEGIILKEYCELQKHLPAKTQFFLFL